MIQLCPESVQFKRGEILQNMQHDVISMQMMNLSYVLECLCNIVWAAAVPFTSCNVCNNSDVS